jgi:VWFA-related protein
MKVIKQGEATTQHARFFICLGVALWFLYTLPLPIPAFCHQNEDQQDIQEEVTVTLKLIQVYVTDEEGNPVTDLIKEDFELRDNGKIKTITEFEKHVLAFPKDEIAQKRVEKTPGIPPKLSRKFLLFFDFAFNKPGGILDGRNAALHFLDTSLQLTDEIGVISFSADKGLTFHEFMTTDHQKVRDVILGFGSKSVLGRADDIERRYYRKLLEIQQSPDLRLRKMKETEARALKAERVEFKQKILNLLNSVIGLAKTLSHIPSQKHVLYFSSGIPNSIFEGAQIDRIMSITGRVFDQGKIPNHTLIERYEDMVKELASSNSVVYAMNSGRIPMPLDWDKDVDQLPVLSADNLENQLTGKASLQQLSQATGGKYFNDVKSYDTIAEEIQNVTGSYYVLGYYINEKWDGKYHEIKVNVEKEGCDVRAQAGYFNPKPFRKYSKLEKLLHFIDLALKEDSLYRTPLSFPLKTLPCTIGKASTLVMMAKIPGEQVEEFLGEKVEVANITFDDKDNVVELTRFEDAFINLPRKDIYFYALSSLPPGHYTYRVVIRNLENGKSAVSSSPVEIIKAPDKGIVLNPPLLLLPEEDVFYLKGSVVEEEDGAEETIGLFQIYPYDRSKYKPVVGGFPQGTPKLMVVLPCSFYNIPQPEIRPFVRLRNQTTGELSPLNFFILDKHFEEGKQFFVLGFPMDSLQRGQYVLDFLAEERTTVSRSTTSAAFVVK